MFPLPRVRRGSERIAIPYQHLYRRRCVATAIETVKAWLELIPLACTRQSVSI